MKHRWLSGLLALSLAIHASAQTCPGDFNADAQIDGNDLGQFLADWGPCSASPCTADFNGDSQVDGVDLGQLLASWGPCRPVITSVSPAEGSVAGGTPITITGRFFLGTTSVRIGGVAASSVTVTSATAIMAVTPPGIAGPATVAVTANGTGALAGGFTYRPSSILGVAPSIGPANGGTAVTITGEYLSSPTSVWFGQSPAQSFSSGSASSITAVAPPGTTGVAVDVRVVTPAGTAVAPGAFTYAAASVSGVAPSVGPAAGGTVVTITGNFLGSPTSVRFGQVPSPSVISVSPSMLRAVSPPGVSGATVDVQVVTPAGVAVAPAAYSYVNITVPPWAELIEAFPDPQVVTDAQLRASIVATGRAWRVRDSATQVEMLLVPPGSFAMGCSRSLEYDCNTHETPVHAVSITNAFYLGRHEVTQSEWQAWTGSNPSIFTGFPDSPSRPVERVTWSMAQSALTAAGMRFATEAEWEYACRASTATAFNNGSDDDAGAGDVAWFGANSGTQTRPVGSKAPNRLGFHDMHGNVWEWVGDWYGSTYYSASPSSNPPGPASGSLRLLRGGAFDSLTNGLRSSFRFARVASLVDRSVGVRVARDP